MKREKVNLKSLCEWLRKATTARLINWQPTEPPVNYCGGNTMRGYETKIGRITVRTIVRQKRSGWEEIIGAVEIVGESGDHIVVSDDPKFIPGEQSKDGSALIICCEIDNEVKNNDLMGTLIQELAHLVHS